MHYMKYQISLKNKYTKKYFIIVHNYKVHTTSTWIFNWTYIFTFTQLFSYHINFAWQIISCHINTYFIWILPHCVGCWWNLAQRLFPQRKRKTTFYNNMLNSFEVTCMYSFQTLHTDVWNFISNSLWRLQQNIYGPAKWQNWRKKHKFTVKQDLKMSTLAEQRLLNILQPPTYYKLWQYLHHQGLITSVYSQSK